ncbi:hypothetical protein FPQ18DRAFT_55938 [Pyronema domesticum]|nr:hypothetical protein FPQ18DRAFT_55938 [Pyronema domesticum]
MRGVFVRKAQMAQLTNQRNQALLAAHMPDDRSGNPSTNPAVPGGRAARFVTRTGPDGERVAFVVVGGGWRDGGVGGIGNGRDYHQSGPQWPPAAAIPGRTSVEEQLPMYEAAPPTYDALYKNGPPQPGSGTIPVVQNDGGSSAANAMEEGRVQRDVLLVTRPEAAVVADGGHPTYPPAGSEVTPQQQGVTGRVWSRITRGLNR